MVLTWCLCMASILISGCSEWQKKFTQILKYEHKERSNEPLISQALNDWPQGKSEFWFPENLNVPRGEAKGNIVVEEKKTHCFLQGQSLRVVIPMNRNKLGRNCLLYATKAPLPATVRERSVHSSPEVSERVDQTRESSRNRAYMPGAGVSIILVISRHWRCNNGCDY